jgi:hypothetical protein
MKRTGACCGLVAGLLLVCCGGHVYGAGGPPPSINDLVGNWVLQCSGTDYDLGDGGTAKYKETVTYQITLAGGDLIHVHCPEWDVDFTGRYRNGVVLTATVDVPAPGNFAITEYLQVTGTAPKLKMTGAFCVFNISEEWGGAYTLKGSKAQ